MTSTVVEHLVAEPGTVTRRFKLTDRRLIHEISICDRTYRSSIEVSTPSDDYLGDWWRGFLRGEGLRPEVPRSCPVRALDLFSGCGGLALGFKQACSELGLPFTSEGAVDQDAEAVDVYRENHGTRRISTESVSTIVDYQVRGFGEGARFVYPPEIVKQGWEDLVGNVDVVLAGPPCQGHSNLNNRTRRVDKRNELYLTIPAIAVAVEAPIVVIENVQAVVHDRLGVVASTITLLRNAGYEVTTGTVHAARLGWAQRRNRYFLVARRGVAPLPLDAVAAAFADDPRSVMWAIGDLADAEDDLVDTPVEISAENRRRIDWLFDHDAYDLPLSERPECHQEGTSYTSVYGRMRVHDPAPTITTGFMTPGRGRYIHPTRRRVLGFREAARLQGFPDTYRFVLDPGSWPSKRSLGKWIGDAVPMPLGYVAGLAALGPGWE